MPDAETEVNTKNSGYDYYTNVLGAPRLVLAPMVDQSELPWRMLSRQLGAELCYTPMFHASCFVKDAAYRRDNLTTAQGDSPLICQFAANDPEIFLQAAQLAAPVVQGIDLNLGCPQVIARRGYYGAYLQNDWDLIYKLIRKVHLNLPECPVSAKIRIFPEIEKTVAYAKMLESAGCQILTVHGRTIDQKGPLTGLCSWSHIKAVKEALKIPVFANGNIQYFADIQQCFDQTGVDAVMTAEGNLHNPAIFANCQSPHWEMAEKYLELVEKFPCPLTCVRGHLFKLFHHTLQIHLDLRNWLAKAQNLRAMHEITEKIRQICQPLHEKWLKTGYFENLGQLPLPHWICQPYVRPDVEREEAKAPQEVETRKRCNEQLTLEAESLGLSKRQLKKIRKNPNKRFVAANEGRFQSCEQCKKPACVQCVSKFCRSCCKDRSKMALLNCSAHGFWFQNIAARHGTIQSD